MTAITASNWFQAFVILGVPLFGFYLLHRLFPPREETIYSFRCRDCGARWSVEDPLVVQAIKTHNCQEAK